MVASGDQGPGMNSAYGAVNIWSNGAELDRRGHSVQA